MAGKIDKETLIKHHFWIVLGLSVLVMPVAIYGVYGGVAETVKKKGDEIAAKQKALTIQKPKAKNYLEALDEQKGKVEDRRGVIWKDVYDKQAGLIAFPPRLAHLDKLYFGDEITADDRSVFRNTEVYQSEYEDLPKLIEPTQFNDGWFKVLKHVNWSAKFPSNEDVWLAVEDLCVQREMLRNLHEANMLLARFEEVTDAKAKSEVETTLKPSTRDGEVAKRFRSPYWELDLAVKRDDKGKAGDFLFRGKLTNISPRRQNVARIEFKVWLRDPKGGNVAPVIVPVDGEYLAVNQSLEFKDRRVTASAPRAALYAVEQKLDGRYVPIKRVDKIALAYNGQRTNPTPLKMGEVSKKAMGDPNAAGGGGAPPAPPPTSDKPGADAASTDRSQNGLDRLRYFDVTKQVRRMPIAIVVVVDQAHLQDVPVALANSRLRFQITQMHWQRFRGTINTNTPSGDAGGSPPPPPPPSAAPREGGGRREGGDGGGPRSDRGGPPSGGPPGSPASSAASVEVPEDVSNTLVEMTVYGLASLYEKFPPKPPTDAQGNPVPPATPPVTPANPPTPSTTPPADAPKPEAPKADAPKAEVPKADAPKPADTPPADQPKPPADAPKPPADAPKPTDPPT